MFNKKWSGIWKDMNFSIHHQSIHIIEHWVAKLTQNKKKSYMWCLAFFFLFCDFKEPKYCFPINTMAAYWVHHNIYQQYSPFSSIRRYRQHKQHNQFHHHPSYITYFYNWTDKLSKNTHKVIVICKRLICTAVGILDLITCFLVWLYAHRMCFSA